MSKKIAVFSAILIVFGGIAVPGGPVVNGLVTDMTYSMVDEGLLGIQDQAGPMVDQMVLDTFTAILFSAAFKGMVMEFAGFPITANDVKWGDFFEDPSAKFEVYVDILGLARVDVFYILGVANYLGEGWLDMNELVYREVTDLVLSDTATGSGVSQFLSEYDACTTAAQKEAMARLYGESTFDRNNPSFDWESSWEDITKIVTYIRDYIQGVEVQKLIDGSPLRLTFFFGYIGWIEDLVFTALEMDTAYIVAILMPDLEGLENPQEIGAYMLWDQWANGTMLPEGFGLPTKAGTYYGFEVGCPTPTNITRAQVDNLWDESSDISLVNSEGIKKWVSYPEKGSPIYNELKNGHGLTDAQMSLFFPWLDNFQHNLMPYLAQEVMSLPVDSITLAGMLEVGMMGLGALFILLGTTGLISNRVVKHNAKKPPKIKSKYPAYQHVPKKPMVPLPKTEYKRVWNKENRINNKGTHR